MLRSCMSLLLVGALFLFLAWQLIKRVSKRPLTHISFSVANCMDCFNYVKGSGSAYLDRAIRYKGRRLLVQPLAISPFNPLNSFLLLALADEFKELENYRSLINAQSPQFITLSRLRLTRWDSVSCDFCSLFNGYLHWLADTLQDYPEMLKKFDESSRAHQLLDTLAVCVDFYIRVGADCQSTSPRRGARDGDLLSKVRYVKERIEIIELRYCPFRAFVDYYRNRDLRYLPINSDVIQEAGRLLDDHPSIECIHCSRLLNDTMDPSLLQQVDQRSPMKSLMDKLFVIQGSTSLTSSSASTSASSSTLSSLNTRISRSP